MKILVFGASGLTGRLVVSQALAQGHQVTAFVRDASRAPAGARVIVGDAEDAAAVAKAVPGHDVVISAIGVGQSFKTSGLIERAAANIVKAMEAVGVRRLIFTSAFGVGDTMADVPFVPRIFMRTLLRRVYADKLKGEGALRGSTLDWTIVSPTGLTNAAGTGTYRAGEHLPLRGFPTISRADVAHFMLTQLADPTYVRKEVLVTT